MINTKIHSKSLIIKSILGRVERPFWKVFKYFEKNNLVVLNYHSTPIKFKDEFEKQILFLKKHFNFLNPSEIDDFYNNSRSQVNSKPLLLITFDDGLKNNLHATEILDKYQIKALFFIVPDFVNSLNQKDFYLKNIRPIINHNIDEEEEDFTAMNWKELDDLVKNGYSIGCHSMTHVMCKGDQNFDNLNNEIINSKIEIESRLNIKLNSFCAPNNSLESINNASMKMIMDKYDYFHATFPGLNNYKTEKYFIKRSNIEVFWPLGAVIYAIGKSERKRWKESVSNFDKLINEVKNGKN